MEMVLIYACAKFSRTTVNAVRELRPRNVKYKGGVDQVPRVDEICTTQIDQK